MASDYFVLVFVASLGVYQIVAIHAKLDGICLFKQSWLQFVFGILALVGAFGWFFTTEERNVQHTVEGSQQLGLFLGAIVAAWVVTGILASIIQAKVDTRVDDPVEEKQYELGIENLKTNTLIGSIMSSLRKGRKDEV
jgi:type VI protein secretion system component VasK